MQACFFIQLCYTYYSNSIYFCTFKTIRIILLMLFYEYISLNWNNRFIVKLPQMLTYKISFIYFNSLISFFRFLMLNIFYWLNLNTSKYNFQLFEASNTQFLFVTFCFFLNLNFMYCQYFCSCNLLFLNIIIN